ncbi:MAG: trypsin-like peptidase domain-containing protein [Ilumatobacteraceae bacterium]
MTRRGVVAALLCGVAPLVACSDDHPDVVLAESVIDIRSTGCGPRANLGVGTAIGDGLIVTAAHVVAGADEILVTGSMGEQSEATIVLIDPDDDIAVLRTPTPIGRPLVDLDGVASAGDHGTVMLPSRGESDARVVDIDVIRPVNIVTTDIYRDRDVERHGFEVSAVIESGDSGAMVLIDDAGAGIIWARSTAHDDRAWAVDLPIEITTPEGRAELPEHTPAIPCP